MKRKFLVIGAILAVACWASMASAYTITVPNADISPYPAPYGEVTVNLVDATHADITFANATTGGYTYLFVDSGAFNLNVNGTYSLGTVNLFSASTAYPLGGFAAASFVSNIPGNVSDFGNFNLSINIEDGARQSATGANFMLTATGGTTWSSAEDVLALNNKDFIAAAHIIVFDSTNVVNGSQLTTGYAAVPIPPSALLMGSGLLGLGLVGFGRRKKGQA